jgi:hypothetical protein
MKKLLCLLLICNCTLPVFAQVKKTDDVKKSLETSNKDTIAWTHGGVLDVGVNEGFLHNWAAGGELASLTVNGIFSGFLNRLYNQHIWTNNLDMTYGLTYAYSQAFLPHKTDDRIDFTSKYGYRIDSQNFYIAALFNFKSQFTKGFDYTVPNWDTFSTSKFLSPAYFTLAIGAEYRRGSNLSLFLSPIAARYTLVDRYYTRRSPEGAFGVPYNETDYFQFGAYFSGRYTANINKNVIYKTRLDLYSNYLAKDTKDSTGKVIKRDNPGNISFLFDNFLAWKVSKTFNITVGLTLMYDNNIPYSKTYVDKTTGAVVDKNLPGDNLGWVEVKQFFSLGLEYKFR